MNFTASYQGLTVTRTSKRAYTHAAVVFLPWSGETKIWSFHTSETLALKSDLTGTQKKNGARVIAVVPVS